MTDPDTARLVETVLHELVTEAEGILLIARALDDESGKLLVTEGPEKLRQAGALVKCVALQCGLAAASMVGAAERLRLVAEFLEATPSSGGGLPF